MTDTDVIILTIVTTGQHLVPYEVRLRRAMKCLLRSYGLRCIDIRPATSPTMTDCAASPTPKDTD
jgi:hypothetical protein